jgi:FkbM family methyltransferase
LTCNHQFFLKKIGPILTRIAVLIQWKRWGVRLISQRRSDAMKQALLVAANTRRMLDVATAEINHLRRVNARYEAAVTGYEGAVARYEAAVATQNCARAGVQAFVNELQRILFGRSETTRQGESASTLILANQSVNDAIAMLVNLSETDHGARSFQYMVPFLAPFSLFPLPWPQKMAPLRIVNVGAQALDSANDIYAPLREVAAMETIVFDPFAAHSDAPSGVMEVRRSDGRVTQTFPCLLADGSDVTLHINRFDATSSILPANHALTRHFGLRDLTIETMTTCELPSRRLDDVLAEGMAVDLLKIDVQGAAHMVLDNARRVLRRTVVCHVEADFAPVYLGERLFADIDHLLRAAGFSFVDFFSIGRQRYSSFDTAASHAFHRGRTLSADCIYIRGLDSPGELTTEELFRAAVIAHTCYNKQDLAAELLGRSDSTLRDAYIKGLTSEATL